MPLVSTESLVDMAKLMCIESGKKILHGRANSTRSKMGGHDLQNVWRVNSFLNPVCVFEEKEVLGPVRKVDKMQSWNLVGIQIFLKEWVGLDRWWVRIVGIQKT